MRDISKNIREVRLRRGMSQEQLAQAHRQADQAQQGLEQAARQLLGYEMYDVLMDENVLPPLVQQLKGDDRLAFQLFCSAYAGRPQEKILQACGRLGEPELQKELLELLEINPFPHDPVEIQ